VKRALSLPYFKDKQVWRAALDEALSLAVRANEDLLRRLWEAAEAANAKHEKDAAKAATKKQSDATLAAKNQADAKLSAAMDELKDFSWEDR
jgi:hypothetical protein